MGRRFAEIVSARLGEHSASDEKLGERETAFLSRTNGFYMATVSERGWPYVQYRGGPRGFLRVLSPRQIGFADFRGNRQYLSVGNAAGNDRAAIIVMDYANPRRLKLLGSLRFVDLAAADPALVRALEVPGYHANVERIALIDIAAFDWNCPQHITRRFALDELPT